MAIWRARTVTARSATAPEARAHHGVHVGAGRQDLALLLNRFGRRLAELRELRIEQPVGRAGSRFEALLWSDTLNGLDTAQLRFFVLEDDEGDRYPAMIDHAAPLREDARISVLRGALVADGRRGRRRPE